MNYYFNKLFIYCFYCMQTKNLHYKTFEDNNIFYHNPVNFMYKNDKDNFDEDFIIIEKK